MLDGLSFHYFLIFWFILSIVIFFLLLFITAPYGRHSRKGWGPSVSSKYGWVIMESVASILFFIYFIFGRNINAVTILFLVLWEIHYINRAFIYPLRSERGDKRIPLIIVIFAMVFNFGNTYINGNFLFFLADFYSLSWLYDPRFLVGTGIFFSGFYINYSSDRILHAIRGKNAGYSIPNGGLYRWISCPNYLGEIIEWVGWAILTWSLAGLSFGIWTAANLIPRAISHHRWYRQKFENYPSNRKAVFPYLV
jgi:protein-S-isoprenylcysteine O-methyltransferase Ste14